jgi:ADP-ribose pyrophosphatase YjhB (NUDIX family)
MRPIRNSAKAIIIQNGKLLATRNEDQWGSFYLLPGGGQEPGEVLEDTLHRECLEEISAEIEVGDIRYIREYIGKHHEFAEWDYDLHQIEFMFDCRLRQGSIPRSGSNPDDLQRGVEWLDISRLDDYRIYPAELKKVIMKDGSFSAKIYLGDVG